MSKPTKFVLLLLLLFWTGVMAAADYIVGSTAFRQFLASSFEATRGKIAVSEVKKLVILHAGVTIEYEYRVNGTKYRGTRYRYDDQILTFDADRVVHKFPAKSEQTIYYDPKNPANSVLSPGVVGANLELIMFSIPVNVVLLIIWSWVLARLREKWRVPEAGGVPIRRLNDQIRVRLAEVTPYTAALLAFGGAAFIATFPTVVIHGFSPPVSTMEIIWGSIFLISMAAFVWKAVQNGSGKYDLLINEGSNTITLPQTCGRRTSVTFPSNEMSGIIMQRRASRSTSGTYYSYLPTLNRVDPKLGQRNEQLYPWGWTEKKASAFSRWLSGQLGVEFKGIQEEKASPVRP